MTVTSGLGFALRRIPRALVVEQSSARVSRHRNLLRRFRIAGYYAGSLLSKFDVRLVMTVGSLIGAIGLAAGRSAQSSDGPCDGLWNGALTSLVPSSAIVTRWFVRKRSIALSIASSGLSLGGIAISPVIATIVDADSLIYWAPRLAIAFLIGMLPAVLFLVRPAPEALGLRPDGDPPLASSAAPNPAVSVSKKQSDRVIIHATPSSRRLPRKAPSSTPSR